MALSGEEMELPAAAAVLENGVGRGVRDVTSGVGVDGRHSAGSEMDEEMTLEVFRACADKGTNRGVGVARGSGCGWAMEYHDWSYSNRGQ